MAILNNSNAISSGGYDINNSVRLRSSASAYLNRTPASAGNRKTWTWSGWVKRGTLGVSQYLFSAGTGGTDVTQQGLNFQTDDTLRWTGAATTYLLTTQVFRDPSAWYHIVFAFDTTQATANDRQKIYINGTKITAFTTQTNPTQNLDYAVNQAAAFNIGRWTGATNPFDGYMAEINFIDGQALTPSSFGETDTTTGVWKPKAYSGTYGTNGFYLKFSDIATTSGSNAGLGKDFSGNTNYWTTNNISVTAGTTYDAMTDSPTLTSATVANYAVMNNIGAVLAGGGTNMPNFAEANLRLNGGSAVWRDSGVSTINMKSGKWYIETTVNTLTGGVIIGLIDAFNAATVRSYRSNATKYINATNSAYGSSYGAGNVVGLAIDCDGGTLTCYVDNVSQGALCTDLVSAMPTNGWFYNPQIYSSSSVSVNFGQRPFAYTPPTGYVALNTFNLPDSTIKKGNAVMDATLYTGTGTAQSITNASAFKPDFVWMKGRSNVRNNNLYDSVRGTTKELNSNTTGAETTNATGLTAFNSNGWTIGSDGGINTSSETYVGWQWQAGQGSTSSNTSGSITSTVSVNTTAGFSIVTYTGNGTTATIGHGLGVAPKMILLKKRNATANWSVYHVSPGATQVAELNLTNAFSASGQWGNTAPTSTVFTQSADNGINWLAYCWAEIAGFSKFGSYTGNGSADGPFVYTGFRPKFVMTKRTDTTSDWIIYDTSRNTYNVTDLRLFPNLSNAETQAGAMDLLSNGFKLRDTGASQNASGGTYIVMAFASNPFKNSLAR